jgi:hypothetical protein
VEAVVKQNPFPNSSLKGVGCQQHDSAASSPEKDLVSVVREVGWSSGQSGREGKFSPPPGFDSLTVQVVASLNPGG